MYRYKAVVEYDGSGFNGWQSQPNGNTIQQYIQNSFKEISLGKIEIFGSGRTDSGVHALGQVFHFDMNLEIESGKITNSLNHFLKKNHISILKIERVDKNFDARRSAILRTYFYKILNRTSPPAILEQKAWHISKKLDFDLMKEAASVFLGVHDFTTFRSSSCEANSPIREIIHSQIEKKGDEIIYRIKSRSFLQHQVRSIVGAIKNVGEKKWSLNDLKKSLLSKNRKNCASPAPACGLYLENVQYE